MLVFFGNSTILLAIPAESRNFCAPKRGFLIFMRVTVADKIINRTISRGLFNGKSARGVLAVNEYPAQPVKSPNPNPRPVTVLPAEAQMLGEAPGVLRQPDMPKRPSRSSPPCPGRL